MLQCYSETLTLSAFETKQYVAISLYFLTFFSEEKFERIIFFPSATLYFPCFLLAEHQRRQQNKISERIGKMA